MSEPRVIKYLFGLNFFAYTIWLSDQLDFPRKYLLIGFVVLITLAALSWPLLSHIREKSQLASLERDGLKLLSNQIDVLAALITARSHSLKNPDYKLPAELITNLQLLEKVIHNANEKDQVLTGTNWGSSDVSHVQNATLHWQRIQELQQDGIYQQSRFAVYNGVINSLLSLIRASARKHRLNVDLELDSTFDLLIQGLPLMLDIIGKQQDALVLESHEMASYALSAHVILAESNQVLRLGIHRLIDLQVDAAKLLDDIELLLSGVAAQQDAVDMSLTDSKYSDKVQSFALKNHRLVILLMDALITTVDAYLIARLNSLKYTQWVITGLLVITVTALAYLFAGIYFSTLRSLKTLSEGTAAFCSGRLDARICIDTKDELVLIARNFNTVATEVERLLGVIREQNESREHELETQVHIRTAQLAEKNMQLYAAGQRVQEEIKLARNMQQAILPQNFPNETTWSVYARMFPARELSGDFYDCFPLPGGRYGILVADVSGKGVGAAFFMAVSRTVLLNLATTDLVPSQVFAHGNDLLCEHNPMELFVTACYGVFDPQTGLFCYANAGHQPPLLRLHTGAVLSLPSSHDLALGVMPGVNYSEHVATIGNGAILLLYTDGVTEAFTADDEAYGEARLTDWLVNTKVSDATSVVNSLVADVNKFIAGAEASDDLTCLVLCRK